jgi:hypothetical protein
MLMKDHRIIRSRELPSRHDRLKAPRPTAPPGRSKRHRPCPAIAPARM